MTHAKANETTKTETQYGARSETPGDGATLEVGPLLCTGVWHAVLSVCDERDSRTKRVQRGRARAHRRWRALRVHCHVEAPLMSLVPQARPVASWPGDILEMPR